MWDVGLTPTGRGYGRGGHTVGGDIRCPPPEHSFTIYFDKAHYGPVSGGGVYPGGKGVESMVG